MAILRLCSVPDCGKKHHSNNYCRSHNARWRAHGDPFAGRAANGEPLAWLQRHRRYTGDDCLIWPFARTDKGYAKYRDTGAYRVLCAMVYGPPPSPAHDAAHSCGNGPGGCVNPQHLRWATKAENSADRLAHGTAFVGTKNLNAKITDADVGVIISLRGRMRQADVGARFGISQSQVGRIQRGEAWRGVRQPPP